jgi:drug/metabolite transporter (DMT)-like permease
VSPFFFTGVGKRVGAFPTNLLRLGLAFLILLALSGARAWSAPLPFPHAVVWGWLIGSGVIGLAIGDAFLYRAFISIGPERTSQIQTLAPAATAVLAWFGLHEVLSAMQLCGMALVLAGVFLATTGALAAARKARSAAPGREADPGEEIALLSAEARMEGAVIPVRTVTAALSKPEGYLRAGLWAAIWSALFQGLGTVLARKAFMDQADLDPLLATTVRIGSGSLALLAYARWAGPMGPILGAWRQPGILRPLVIGTLFGPLIGMICYITALKHAPAGVVTTITFMAPLLIIPIGARLYSTRIAAATLWGAALSVAGVALLGLGR